MIDAEQNLKYAAGVKGYLAEDEGRALFKYTLEAAHLLPVLEIGSFCGKSTVYLGTACRINSVTLFSVDHHTGSEEQQPGQLYFDPELYDKARVKIDSFPLFRKTIHEADLEDTVVPLITWSEVAARNWAIPLSLIFIDGGHSYKAVLQDYLNWNLHLASGGFLIFHDIYFDPSLGGQAPLQVYQVALASNQFEEHPMVNTLGILKKR